MSGSNCHFLTCIQVSQEADGLVFPSLSEISTVYCDPHSRDPSKLRPRLSAQKPRPLGFGQCGDPLPDLPTDPCQLALTSPGFPTLTAQSPTFRPLRVLKCSSPPPKHSLVSTSSSVPKPLPVLTLIPLLQLVHMSWGPNTPASPNSYFEASHLHFRVLRALPGSLIHLVGK